MNGKQQTSPRIAIALDKRGPHKRGLDKKGTR